LGGELLSHCTSDTLRSLRLVCKEFNAAVEASVAVAAWPEPQPLPSIETLLFLRRLPSLRTLRLSREYEEWGQEEEVFTDDDIAVLADITPQLKTEFSYRYMNSGSFTSSGSLLTSPSKSTISSHQMQIGFRYMID
jgi:hypothetical protein